MFTIEEKTVIRRLLIFRKTIWTPVKTRERLSNARKFVAGNPNLRVISKVTGTQVA